MEDRLRYRAWDKENKRYIYDVENGLRFYSATGFLKVITLAEIAESDKYELEQCTGLRDWKNHLIYEGDIIKLVGPNWRFVIKWNRFDICFIFDALDNVNWWNLSASVPGFIAMSVEVIDNIHKKPELMEG